MKFFHEKWVWHSYFEKYKLSFLGIMVADHKENNITKKKFLLWNILKEFFNFNLKFKTLVWRKVGKLLKEMENSEKLTAPKKTLNPYLSFELSHASLRHIQPCQ